jgi:hypothetical protein
MASRLDILQLIARLKSHWSYNCRMSCSNNFIKSLFNCAKLQPIVGNIKTVSGIA